MAGRSNGRQTVAARRFGANLGSLAEDVHVSDRGRSVAFERGHLMGHGAGDVRPRPGRRLVSAMISWGAGRLRK